MSSARASPILPTETWIKLGIGPIEKRVHFDRRLGRTKIRPRKQRKAQIAELFGATQAPHANVAAILRHNAIETRPWDEIHDLRKQRPASVQGDVPDRKNRGNYRKTVIPSSNRHQTKSTLTLATKTLSTPPSALNRTAVSCARSLRKPCARKKFR